MKNLVVLFLGLFISLTAYFAHAATVTPTNISVYGYGVDKSQRSTWSNMNTGDTAVEVKAAAYPFKSAAVSGTLSASNAIVIYGSNDGVMYFPLTDQANNTLAFTAAGIKKIEQTPMYIRPVVSGTVTSATVSIILTK